MVVREEGTRDIIK